MIWPDGSLAVTEELVRHNLQMIADDASADAAKIGLDESLAASVGVLTSEARST